MNCWKFATIKSGTVSSSFNVKFTDRSEEQTSYTGVISKSSPLNLNLTYKDLCRIDKGVELGKPWAIRGPECDSYHTYTGNIVAEGFVGPLGTIPNFYSGNTTYDVYMAISYNLFGCSYDDLSQRLNAYGRRAKKAKDDAPPPDPESPEPCVTQSAFYMIAAPEGTEPDNDITQNILIDFGVSPELTFAYGSANNEPYTSTGIINLYYYNPNAEDGIGVLPYDVEVKGTRNLQITNSYGE
jgi:hypothetical protein